MSKPTQDVFFISSLCFPLGYFLIVQDGEPVSKMAEEYMNKGKAMLEDKKAGFEAHKVKVDGSSIARAQRVGW